jgi:hypothetical protein
MVLNPVSLALWQQEILDSSQFSAAYPTERANYRASYTTQSIERNSRDIEIAMYRSAGIIVITSTIIIGLGTVVTTTMELLLKMTGSEKGVGAAAVEKGKLDRQWYEEHHDWEVPIEEGSDHILGAHIAGLHAEEQINIFALAIPHGITSEDLKEIIFVYPTGSSGISYIL